MGALKRFRLIGSFKGYLLSMSRSMLLIMAKLRAE